MRLTIHSDPQEPTGGFAFLELPGGSLGTGRVMVGVFEVYGSRWLGPSDADGDKVEIGDGNWQGERHEFGPYLVHAHDGADWVRIGPEIVNKIEEYTPLRLTIGTLSEDVTWPDDVPPRAGAAVLGGLQSTALGGGRGAGAALVGKAAAPEPEQPPEPAPPPVPPELAPEPEPELDQTVIFVPPKKTSKILWWLLLLLVLTGLALGVAWWFFWRQQPVLPTGEPPVAETGVETVEPGTGEPASPCTRAALTTLAGFAATRDAIRTCGDALSPDTVLSIVEDAASTGDKDALLLFGTLYDGATVDARIETVIGLSFADNPALAAEYYARAHEAGSAEAETRLGGVCALLAGATDVMAKGAFDDFCE
ncbi:MAG: hypothetical protein L3J36_02065 [Rhodobacteraceae bacterium]|nr:hypothetical protein [Paracoccaceae bacterium]